MKEIKTKEDKRLGNLIEKTLYEDVVEQFFGKGGIKLKDEILIRLDGLEFQKNSNVKNLLYSLTLVYLVARDSGEYTSYYFLNREFECLVICDNGQ